jgi:Kef-type K+ transport system membrane component KefB
MVENVFLEFSLILGISALIGFIGLQLRQPLIVSFIAVGILVGPSVLDIVQSGDKIDLLAHIGIAILLFVVGLKLDLHIIKNMGLVALATGLGQVIFTSIFGFLIALLLGYDPIAATYIAVALTFSSTIIIVKLLSDKKELDTLHGKIAIGFLIVQDIAVILAMILLTAIGGSDANDTTLSLQILKMVGSGIFMLVVVALIMKYIIPSLLKMVARSSEMLILFAIAWAVVGASAGHYLGFSKEVGAFLAGITIASTPYRDMIAARLVGLRDFLLLFFFINLGAGLELGLLGGQIVPAIILSIFILIGNPLIVMVIMGYMGYRKRTGLLAGFTVAQISEFSLILVALGYTLGHLSQESVGLVTLVGLITISASTYMILYSHHIYTFLAPYLHIFERKVPHREITLSEDKDPDHPDTVVFGLGRFGKLIAHTLQERGKNIVGIDFNPDLIHTSKPNTFPVQYGDVENPDFISHMDIQEIKWIICTIRDYHIGMIIIDSLKEAGYSGKIAISCHSETEARKLREYGADLTLIPYRDAAYEAVDRILDHDKKD